MNDFTIKVLCFAQRTLGSPEGKLCKSLERNVWRKVVSSSKAVILDKQERIFPVILSEAEVTNVGTWKL